MDYTRAEEFKKHLEEIQRQIGFKPFLGVIQDKLIDYAAKNPDADIAEILIEVKKVFPPEYKKYVDLAFDKYDDVIELTNYYYEDIGTPLTRKVNDLRALEKTDRIRYGEYGERTIKRITDIVHKVLLDEPDRKTLEQSLIKKVDDARVAFYADTIAWTQVKAFGRAGKSIKANIAEIFFFDYFGPRRETTRPECIWALIKKTFSTAEIEQQDSKSWRGQIKPFKVYCGGWNCAHDLEPNPFVK